MKKFVPYRSSGGAVTKLADGRYQVEEILVTLEGGEHWLFHGVESFDTKKEAKQALQEFEWLMKEGIIDETLFRKGSAR